MSKRFINVMILFLMALLTFSLVGFIKSTEKVTRDKTFEQIIEDKLSNITHSNDKKILLSSNPYDYIKGKKISKDYKYIVSHGKKSLDYMLTKFANSKENGLNEYIMAIACSEILRENPLNKNWSSGRAWYNDYIKNKGSKNQSKNEKNDFFSLIVPSNWKAVRLGNSGMYFGESENDYFGGVFKEELNVNFNAGEKKLPSKDSLLQWMLPNHTEVTKVEELKGFFTETYLINLISSEPAGQGGKITGKWTYIIFIDKNKSTSIKWVAYEIYLNTKYGSEKEVINIAKTFKIIK